MAKMRNVIVRALIVVLALAPLAGCASQQAYRRGEVAAQQGDWDQAVLYYLKAQEEDPENITYRAAVMRAKIKASQMHFEQGQEFEKAGVTERALVEYQQAVQLDPTNQYAKAQLEHVRQAYVAQRQGREASTIEQMKKRAQESRPQPPVLNPRSNQPISMDFPEPVPIFQIYRSLGKAFGINILFDPNLKDQEINIELKDVTAQTALETLMRAAGHFYKVLDEHTILIAADTPQNRRIYEDLVIQNFFLSNAEVKDMMTILRSLVDAKKIATNDQLNAIIVRDTADKVKVAERIIEANDKSKAEVVIDVELLQINSGRLRDLGVSLSQYSIGQSIDRDDKNPLRLSDIEFLNQADWILTIPSFVYNFLKNSTEAQLLAKPQLRITDGEKASLIIGDRVPIPLTTFNTQNVGGQGAIVPITSFQYQDVGIRMELEPRVHHNQEITLKVKVQVSNITGFVEASAGQRQPTIGTREFDSTIRLQDGETNFLAGLIRTDETNTENGIPGISEIPILGRLFSNKRSESQRTDVILTLTPHIIRNAQITEEDLQPIWVGTEANITFRGGSPRVESEVGGPFEGDEGTPEEVQDAIRRRLQRLPRGLQPGEEEVPMEEEQPQEVQPPTGVELVPVAPPTDIFRPPVTEPPPVEEEPPPPPPDNQVSSVNASGTAWLGGVRLAGYRSPLPLAPSPAKRERGKERGLGGGAPLPLGAGGGGRAGEGSGEGVYAAARRPAAVRLWVAPSRLTVSPGESFEVTVEVAAGRPVSHLPITLTYDPAVLAVEKVEPGDFLGEAGTAQVLADTGRPGVVTLGASRLGEVPAVSGAGTLARITFRAVAAGSARIGFGDSQALDPALRPVLPLRTAPATVDVRRDGRPAPGPRAPQKQGTALEV